MLINTSVFPKSITESVKAFKPDSALVIPRVSIKEIKCETVVGDDSTEKVVL